MELSTYLWYYSRRRNRLPAKLLSRYLAPSLLNFFFCNMKIAIFTSSDLWSISRITHKTCSDNNWCSAGAPELQRAAFIRCCHSGERGSSTTWGKWFGTWGKFWRMGKESSEVLEAGEKSVDASEYLALPKARKASYNKDMPQSFSEYFPLISTAERCPLLCPTRHSELDQSLLYKIPCLVPDFWKN